MTLYQLTDEFLQLLEMAEDPDTDLQALTDTMEAINADLEDKADGYAIIIRQMTGDMETIKAEIDRLNCRKMAMEKNIDRMKDNLRFSMGVTGKTKFKTARFNFSIAKNPPAVVMDTDDIAHIPEEYHIPQPDKIDKRAIKDALKAGADLTGVAHLEQSMSLRIR